MAATTKGKEEPLHLKQGSKLFSKLLTKESSVAAPSFRVYYGVASAGSVPFLWESQPGTPKNTISTTTLPPLTPPPSYYIGAAKDTSHKTAATAAGGGKKSKPGFLSSILPKIILRKARSSSSPSSSCSSSSSSSLSFRSTQSPACSSMRGSNRRASFSVGDDEEEMMTACFRVQHESFRAFKGCRVAMTVRSALASVGGSSTAQRGLTS